MRDDSGTLAEARRPPHITQDGIPGGNRVCARIEWWVLPGRSGLDDQQFRGGLATSPGRILPVVVARIICGAGRGGRATLPGQVPGEIVRVASPGLAGAASRRRRTRSPCFAVLPESEDKAKTAPMPPVSRSRQTVPPGAARPVLGTAAEEGPAAVDLGANPGDRGTAARVGSALLRAAAALPTEFPLATGITRLDELLGGGLPRGALSEINAPNSAGAMSLALRIAARTTGEGRGVAWIDPSDVLDPGSLETVGVDMRSFLWVRPAGERAAFATAEILAGLENAFALVVLDLARPWGKHRLVGGAHRSRPPTSLAIRAGGMWSTHDGDGGAIRRAAIRAGNTRPAHWLRLAATLRRGRADVALLVLGGETERCFSPACALRLEIVPERARWTGAVAAWRLLGTQEIQIHVRRRRKGSLGGSIRLGLAAVRPSGPRAMATESTSPDVDKIIQGHSAVTRTATSSDASAGRGGARRDTPERNADEVATATATFAGTGEQQRARDENADGVAMATAALAGSSAGVPPVRASAASRGPHDSGRVPGRETVPPTSTRRSSRR